MELLYWAILMLRNFVHLMATSYADCDIHFLMSKHLTEARTSIKMNYGKTILIYLEHAFHVHTEKVLLAQRETGYGYPKYNFDTVHQEAVHDTTR